MNIYFTFFFPIRFFHKMSSLSCAEHEACDAEISEATVYCVQCNSLQCILCEREIHQSSAQKNHERLNLDAIDGEYCSINERHPAVFYCPTCALSFCYVCYMNQHQHSDRKKHKPQKFKKGQLITTDQDK